MADPKYIDYRKAHKSLSKDTNAHQALSLPNDTLIITRTKKKFKVIDTLQKSIYRAVYVASLKDTEEKFVIKVEPPNPEVNCALKMEKAVAAALQCSTPMEAERFAEFVDYGDSTGVNFKFIIWKRLGPSLDELHQMYRQKFSLATSTRINVQTLRAISKLHSLGFIHRNIQPSHFVVGEVAKRVVYIISFSLCRAYTTTPDGLDGLRGARRPSKKRRHSPSKYNRRKLVRSSSTSKSSATNSFTRECTPSQQYFAPRFWYTPEEGTKTFSRLDDIESWLYLSLHFIAPESLPWCKTPIQMLTEICELKRDFFLHVYSGEIFSKIPSDYRRCIDEINASIANSPPDYEKIISIAKKISQQACPNANSPYDWEEIPAPLLSDYGEFRVPAPSVVINPNADASSAKKTKTLGTDDPEMDRLVENWQKKFRKLILSGVPRAEAYQKVMGIAHPSAVRISHPPAAKPKKKNKKSSKTVAKTEATQDPS